MALQIQWRRDLAANWTANNPTLAQGEPGFETDTGAYKIGDGVTAWNSLAYGAYSTDPIAALFADQASGTDPSAPSSDQLLIYGKTIANRMMFKQIGPSGLATALQPFLARNKVGYWNPPGNTAAVTLPEVFGYTAPTALGTATVSTMATTNLFMMMRRISYVSATTADAYGGQRVSVAQVNMNNGFYKITRFGISDASLASPAQLFIGVSSTTAAPSGGTEPNTLTNLIGVGHGSADTNLQIFYGGTDAQPQVDLGANFPINTTNTDAYELALFSPPGDDVNAYYEVTRINTGNVVTGVILGDGGGAVLPAPSTSSDIRLALALQSGDRLSG